jgi:hypothetical protein
MALQIVRKYKWDNKRDLSLSRRCFYKNKRKISPKRRLLFTGWKTTTGCSESDLHRSQRRFTCHEYPHKISAQSDHKCLLIGALDEIWTEVPENWRQPFFFFFFFSRTLLSLSKDRSHPLLDLFFYLLMWPFCTDTWLILFSIDQQLLVSTAVS